MAYPRSSSQKTFNSVRVKAGFVQRRPYVSPLPYSSYGGTDQRTDSAYPLNPISNPYALGVVQGGSVASSLEVRLATSAAYDRIIARVKGQSTASVATSVMERRESFDMIAKRATQLRGAYSSLRKGDVSGMMTQFGFKRKQLRKKTEWVRLGKNGMNYRVPTKKTRLDEIALKRGSKKVGSLWLEYWFGWAPLVNDVYSTVTTLADPLPPETLRNVFRGTGHSNKNYSHRDFVKKKYLQTDAYSAQFMASYTARVKAKSPNLALMNRLGLVNPAATAYELMPFSWLVDWFLPVGRFIESFTDTVGFSVDRVVSSQKRTVSRQYYMWIAQGAPSGADRVTTTKSDCYMSSRSVMGSLPVPGLFDRRGTALSSMTRAATAVSLLAGYFKTSR